jgi:gliding motility-associated-like protein
MLTANGDFTYTPDLDFNGSDYFTYEVCDDGAPSACSQAVVMITINPIDDNLPPMVDDINVSIAANSDTTICINATDPDGDNLFINSVSVSPVNGSLVLSNTEPLCLLYRPNNDFSGTDEIVVEICDGQTCVLATIQIIIEELPLYIYQAVSPNNDNRNDTWIIDGITRFPENEVKIFNRYGNLVYKSAGYDNDRVVWRGESNNGLVLSDKELPDGTYFYVIDLGNGNQPQSGYVVLNR